MTGEAEEKSGNGYDNHGSMDRRARTSFVKRLVKA